MAKKLLKTDILNVKEGLEEFKNHRENGFAKELMSQNG